MRENGEVMKKDERIKVEEEIREVKIEEEWKWKMDDIKGRIKEGKDGDLVIMEENKMKVEKEKIRKIKVREKWMEGKRRY